MKRSSVCTAFLFVSSAIAQNTTQATKNYHDLDPGLQVSYAKQVAPIFQAKCLGCHSEGAHMGGLVLADHASLMKGGANGQAIVPRKADESRMVKMLEGALQPRMPMGGQLEESEIATIKLWIDQGAKLDQEVVSTAKDVQIPSVKPAAIPAEVGALAFSPDGRLLAAGGFGEVTFYHAQSGQKLGKLMGPVEMVRAIGFSQDGKYLAIGSGRPALVGDIKIWKVETEFWRNPAAQTISAHRDCVYAVAFSPDGKLLASTSYDRMIYLWDPATGQEVKRLKEHTDAVFDLAFSPDGKWLASGGADRTVKLWSIESGKRVHTLGSASEGVNTLTFHPSGKTVALSGFDKTIHVWDLTRDAPEEIFTVIAHEDTILRLAYSPDGRWLVTSSWDKSIKIWDAGKLVQARVIPNQPDWVLALAFSPDGKQLVVGRYDGSVSVYETANFSLVRNLTEPAAQRAGLQ